MSGTPKADAAVGVEIVLPNVQKAKFLFLLERGATVKSAQLLLQTPNGLCTLDDFGHVEWITEPLRSAAAKAMRLTRSEIIAAARLQDADIGDDAMIVDGEWSYCVAGSIYVAKMPDPTKQYLSDIGRKGGQKSRRVLTPAQARAMVRARVAKRKAAKIARD